MSKAPAQSSQRNTIAKLRMLVRASELLNSSLELEEILDRLLKYTTTSLNAAGGTIYLLDRKKKELWSERMRGGKKTEIRLPVGEGIAGHVAKTGESIRIKDVYRDPRFFPGIDKRTGFRTKSMICAPMMNRARKMVGVFQILNKKVGTFSRDDEKFLNAISIPATIAIENARLHKSEIEARVFERDLDIASRLQQQILPSSLPVVKGAQLVGATTPCRAVGGDFFDVVRRPDDTLTMAIADVSGKGIGAALLVSTFQASLQTYVEFGLPLMEIISKLNRILFEGSTSESFVTCVLCTFDPKSGALHYVNAGHNYPVIVRKNGDQVELPSGGYCLGMLPEARFEEEKIFLGDGDLLVLYTDGVTEAMNDKRDPFGEPRLFRTLSASREKPVNAIASDIFDEVKTFAGNQAQADDLTLLLLKAGEGHTGNHS